MASAKPIGFHHVAYACRDIHENHHFYGDLLGLELVHTEVAPLGDGFFRHVFYDTGDGSCIAFFDLHGVGEQDRENTAVSTGLGFPVWTNHFAFRSDPARTEDVSKRAKEEGRRVFDIDHGWCQSTYILDPNDILVELCSDTPGFEPDPKKALELLDALPAQVKESS